jgi:hypothetical protein
VAWGEQLDIRVVRDPGITAAPGALTEGQVAGYLAKYATKSTEATGHRSGRLTADDAKDAGRRGDHVGRLIQACWAIGRREADEHAEQISGTAVPTRLRYARLRRWAHMLGFGGHFSTKSRRYSTTLGALRRARIDWREERRRRRDLYGGRDRDVVETTLLVGHLTYTGTGWLASGDALLAATAAAQARDHPGGLRVPRRPGSHPSSVALPRTGPGAFRGANVKAVQRMLGHASASMTLDVYAGLFADDLDDVAARLDLIIASDSRSDSSRHETTRD